MNKGVHWVSVIGEFSGKCLVDYGYFFYSDVKPLSKYSPVMLLLSPVT